MTDLLFYRVIDGAAAVGHIASGKYVNTDNETFTENFTDIVVVGNQLLFYRAVDALPPLGTLPTENM